MITFQHAQLVAGINLFGGIGHKSVSRPQQRCYTRIRQPIVNMAPLLSILDQTTITETGQVTGNIALGQPSFFGYLGHGELRLPQRLKDGESGRIGEPPKEFRSERQPRISKNRHRYYLQSHLSYHHIAVRQYKNASGMEDDE
jgi:hypothetical protein